MVILPAIDLKDGAAVRLYQGDFSTAHRVADDPLETAKVFEAAGAEWIHMVDLNGAKTGRPVHEEIILSILRQTNLQVELGGGIRDMDALERYAEHGVHRLVLGSAALKDPVFVRTAAAKYGDKIAVGIDAKDGFVAAEGWLDVSQLNYLEFGVRMADAGITTIIFTDISRDGMLTGPNFESLATLQEAIPVRIVASGGISSINDIRRLAGMGLYGAICGKSIYSGSLELSEALKVAKNEA